MMPKGHKHSEESKNKMSESHKGKNNHFYGRHHSKESKDKISEKNKGRHYHSEEQKNKWSEDRKGKHMGKDNPMFGRHHSEESKRKMSEHRKGENNGMFGKHHTEDAKNKIGKINKIKNKGKTVGHPLYRPHRSDLKYKDTTFRSSWELKFAQYLDSIEEPWDYESKQFHLGDSTYTPDFYLKNFDLYIEIKGHWMKGYKEKFEKFKQMYPTTDIVVIEHSPPYELPSLFKHTDTED